MAGGTHHAFLGEGSGYCIFNDLAICAEVALGRPGVNRILILDLDVHQGDGTAEIFDGDERVFYPVSSWKEQLSLQEKKERSRHRF